MSFGLFPDFFDRPQDMSFAQQEKDEKIELLLRQHAIVNIPWIGVVVLSLFLPSLVGALDSLFGLGLVDRFPEVFLGIFIVWFLVITGYAIESFLHWYFNIYIVTNMHLVDINFRSLLSRDITESKLSDIQSISSKVQGVLASIFHYGDVIVETAAERQNISFLKVPKPDIVADRIQDLQENQERIEGGQ